MDELDSYLFHPETIDKLNWSLLDEPIKIDSKFKIRPLSCNDYERGHLDVICQLTTVGDVSREQYEERFKFMKQSNLVKIVVIEDSEKRKIAASASLLCEPKFTHNCSWIAHVQDVVVDEEYRGKGLGKALIWCLKLLALDIGAYKMDLDCADDKIRFYKSLGFQQESGRANYLVQRFVRA